MMTYKWSRASQVCATSTHAVNTLQYLHMSNTTLGHLVYACFTPTIRVYYQDYVKGSEANSRLYTWFTPTVIALHLTWCSKIMSSNHN